MNNIVYGFCDGSFYELSDNLKAAKRMATIRGYSTVYAFHRVSWAVWEVSMKNGKRWSDL